MVSRGGADNSRGLGELLALETFPLASQQQENGKAGIVLGSDSLNGTGHHHLGSLTPIFQKRQGNGCERITTDHSVSAERSLRQTIEDFEVVDGKRVRRCKPLEPESFFRAL